MGEGESGAEREVPYQGRDRNPAGTVSHQKSRRWLSLLDSVLLHRTKAAGRGRGRGGGFLAAGDGQAMAEGSSPSAIRKQWLALLIESLPSQWDEKRVVEAFLSLLLSTCAASDFICD